MSFCQVLSKVSEVFIIEEQNTSCRRFGGPSQTDLMLKIFFFESIFNFSSYSLGFYGRPWTFEQRKELFLR